MPKRRTEDVVHAVITDHFIQRQIPARDLLAELPERHLTDAEDYHGEVVPYYPSPLPQTGENPLYQAVAQVALQNNLQQGLDDLSREISRQPPREMEFYTTLGMPTVTAEMPNRRPLHFSRQCCEARIPSPPCSPWREPTRHRERSTQ